MSYATNYQNSVQISGIIKEKPIFTTTKRGDKEIEVCKFKVTQTTGRADGLHEKEKTFVFNTYSKTIIADLKKLEHAAFVLVLGMVAFRDNHNQYGSYFKEMLINVSEMKIESVGREKLK